MKQTGGPAFPRPSSTYDPDHTQYGFDAAHDGMSMRDWFAGQVIARLIGVYGFEDGEDKRILAERAYEMADAMLAEREKE